MLEFSQTGSPLLVEVLLADARITGLCTELGMRRRLAEVLNTHGDVFELHSATLEPRAGAPSRGLEMTIEKKAIIAAIPHETEEQDRKRFLETRTVGRTQTLAAEIVVLAAPFVICGTAHMTTGYGTTRGRPHADAAFFPRFFSVTAACIDMPDGRELHVPVVLVNRDLVAAMGQSGDPPALRKLA